MGGIGFEPMAPSVWGKYSTAELTAHVTANKKRITDNIAEKALPEHGLDGLAWLLPCEGEGFVSLPYFTIMRKQDAKAELVLYRWVNRPCNR